MEYYVQQFSDEPPGPWAAAREGEGWHGIGAYDHWYLESIARGLFHPFAVLGNVAAHTSRIRLTTTFGNNIARSPVEFAQAALTLNYVSNGRFDPGLGAGWSQDEIVRAGMSFPSAPERARRLKEAVIVVRQLLRGAASFEGEFYQVDLPRTGPQLDEPPRLFAALGGEWTIRHIGPLVDSIELATMGHAFRDGANDWDTFVRTDLDWLRRLVDLGRAANPSATIGLSLFVFTGQGRVVDGYRQMYEAGCFRGLAGSAGEVAERIRAFGELDVDRITVLPPLPLSAAELAPELLG
jgi:alkanesulfonate monooxygenase SsuD/methylene tetrahydromethanopterin reductase-like flavin-dependent oxidoreductase (luciferase family)